MLIVLAAHFTEILIIGSNGALAWITYMIVPEEKHPHVIRRTRHHLGRVTRAIRPGRSQHVARHRQVRV